MTNQNSSAAKVDIVSPEYSDCVMVTAGNGAELWNILGDLDAEGKGTCKIIGARIHDCIMAYEGWGITQQETNNANSGADVLCGGAYCEYEDCIFENNIIMYPHGEFSSAYAATDHHERGWSVRNNTYIMNTSYSEYKNQFEDCVRNVNHNISKRVRITTPFNYRYMVYYTSNGIDPSGTYYLYDGENEYQAKDSFFMTGWHILHGGSIR